MTLRNELAPSDDLRAGASWSTGPVSCTPVTLVEMVALLAIKIDARGTSSVVFAEDFTREHSGDRSHLQATEIAGIF